MHHIRDCLPEIKSKLNAMMQNVSQELMELGESTDCVSAASLGATLVRICFLLLSLSPHDLRFHSKLLSIYKLVTTMAHDMRCVICDGEAVVSAD